MVSKRIKETQWPKDARSKMRLCEICNPEQDMNKTFKVDTVTEIVGLVRKWSMVEVITDSGKTVTTRVCFDCLPKCGLEVPVYPED
jgi:hypothetical protein